MTFWILSATSIELLIYCSPSSLRWRIQREKTTKTAKNMKPPVFVRITPLLIWIEVQRWLTWVFVCLRAGKLSHISVVLWEIYQEYSHERALVVRWAEAVLEQCGGEIFADTISMLFWLWMDVDGHMNAWAPLTFWSFCYITRVTRPKLVVTRKRKTPKDSGKSWAWHECREQREQTANTANPQQSWRMQAQSTSPHCSVPCTWMWKVNGMQCCVAERETTNKPNDIDIIFGPLLDGEQKQWICTYWTRS